MGHLFQHLISAEVSYCVIDDFEGIQINKKHTNMPVILPGGLDTLFQLILE
ncbi:hypothetical protein D3C80_1752370 [compost metagenome]